MAISIIAYSFLWGWKFALGFVIMLFIHEMGHVIALKRKGYKASAPVFIPMLGAAIFVPAMNNAEDEAYIGYGGPLVGSLAALGLWKISGFFPQYHELLLRISYVALFLNLFNLIPIRPLDGGRVTQAVGGWFKYVGLSTLLGLSIMIKEPQMLLIWVLVVGDLPLNPKAKFQIAGLCTTAMVILMVSGYGDQFWWMNTIDSLLACTYTWGLFSMMKTGTVISEANHPPLPLSRKVYWFGVYATTLAALIYFMTVVGGSIPKVVSIQ